MRAKIPTNDAKMGGLDRSGSAPIPEISELRLLRAIDELDARLGDVGDAEKALRMALRAAADLLGAPHRCTAILIPGRPEAQIESTGAGDPGPLSWPAVELARFARGEKPNLPADVAVARLRRRRRPWGTMALRWPTREPAWNARHALTRLASVTNDHLERLEIRRLAEVRARIDRKIIEQLRPKDLLYQVLDGLRSLTGYDHSGLVMLRSEASSTLEVAAEQLAYRKGKGARVGAAVVLPAAVGDALSRGGARGLSWHLERWSAWDEVSDAAIAAWLDHALPPLADHAPAPAELIVAPLRAADDLLGVIVLAARHTGVFWPYECELVDALLPHAMVSLRNARRAESLEDQVIQSERKHAMAELARGVSHDVNNALGAMLPLVQQLRSEAESGQLDPATVREDLASIEHSVQACVRIFNNMLQFARRSADEATDPSARLDLALDAVQAIHGDGLRRNGIVLHRSLHPELPRLPLRQAELEQVMLNLVSNARDAVLAAGAGGEIIVAASLLADAPQRDTAVVRVEVHDSGIGIDAPMLPRVIEPFFTTKPRGNGLGLSICRAILWQCRGRIGMASPRRDRAAPQPRGATVTIDIPCRPEARS